MSLNNLLSSKKIVYTSDPILPYHSPGNTFLKREGKFIGSKYKKALYREYTDDTFTKPKDRSADMEHLGIMGKYLVLW